MRLRSGFVRSLSAVVRGACARAVARVVFPFAILCAPLLCPAAPLEPFRLPTANQALFEKGGEERFFVGTAGKPWTTCTFGCVRSGGLRIPQGVVNRRPHRTKRRRPAYPAPADVCWDTIH